MNQRSKTPQKTRSHQMHASLPAKLLEGCGKGLPSSSVRREEAHTPPKPPLIQARSSNSPSKSSSSTLYGHVTILLEAGPVVFAKHLGGFPLTNSLSSLGVPSKRVVGQILFVSATDSWIPHIYTLPTDRP